jgi:hypothetical protein
MADIPEPRTPEPGTTILVKNELGSVREIDRTALPFFPGYTEVATDAGPKRNASADEWRTYVVAKGFADEVAAADMTRDELIALVDNPKE